MKHTTNRPASPLWIAPLLALGLAGCGGGGGGGDGDTLPLLALTTDNADEVTGMATDTAGTLDDTGGNTADSFSLGASLTGGAGNSFNVAGFVRSQYEKLYTLQDETGSSLARAVSTEPFNCTGGGTFSITGDFTDETLSTGDTFSMNFNNCVEDGATTNGGFSMTLTAVSGDPSVDAAWNVSTTVNFNNLRTTEGGETASVDGDLTVGISDNGATASFTLTANSFTVSDGGDTITLSDLGATGTFNESTLAYTFELDGTFSSTLLNGSVTIETITPFSGVGDFDPDAGVMKITGANNSSVKVTALSDSTNVQVEVDADGDGVTDAGGLQVIAWADL